MKKLFTAIAIAALSAGTLSARDGFERQADLQDRGWEINAGASLVNYFNLLIYILPAALTNDPDDGLENSSEFSWPGSFIIEPRYNFNSWFSAGLNCQAQIMNDHKYKTETDSETGVETKKYAGTSRFHVYTVMPSARFKYMNHPKCTLYGSAQAGLALYLINGGKPQPIFSFQINPIGVTFGSKLYGYAELGIGTQWFGGHLGIGYRF